MMQNRSPDRLHSAPEIFGAAIKGQRSEQQDSIASTWLPNDGAWLAIIADGMGGHAAGEVASRIAVDGFVSTFVAERSVGAALGDAFNIALGEANSLIAGAQQQSPELSGMGTTLVAAHISAHGLAWISVGDSPLWLFRAGTLTRLNEDHSLRAIVAGGARTSGNILQSALTGAPIEMIDCRTDPVQLRAGDAVLVASDGLLTLGENDIAGALQMSSPGGPEAAVRSLLKAVEAGRKPNQDNCSVIIALPHAPKSRQKPGRSLMVAVTIALVLAITAVIVFELRTSLLSLSIN
jgi:PPM family protein phosphatase